MVPLACAQSSSSPQNPTARQFVIQALEAMGAPGGVVTRATATIHATVSDQREPDDPRNETLWAKGTTRLRIDWQNSTSKHSYAINQGVRSASHSKGVDHPPSFARVLWARPNFFPLFSLLAEWNSPHTTITLLKDQTVNGRLAHVVCISVDQLADTGYKILDPHITETMFYIDSQTNQLLRISNGHPPSPVHVVQLDEHIDYADYQKIGNLAVPLRQTTYIGGHLTSTLNINSVELDGNLDDAFFTVGAKSNGN